MKEHYQGLGHVAIYTADIDQSIAFYEKIGGGLTNQASIQTPDGEKQLALVRYLEESVRFFDCQLVIATHSPLLLGMRGAKVYHLDECPARVRRWTELPEVRVWRDFFRAHEREFED